MPLLSLLPSCPFRLSGGGLPRLFIVGQISYMVWLVAPPQVKVVNIQEKNCYNFGNQNKKIGLEIHLKKEIKKMKNTHGSFVLF